MRFWQSVTAAISGRRSIIALGVMYLMFAAGYPFLPLIEDRSLELWVVLGVLVGGPGLVLLYGGYRLPRTDIHPEFYPTVGTWCLRGVAVGLGIMVPIVLASGDSNIVGNTLLLTALGSLAGFGAGSYDARAKTRTRQLQETIEQLETSNERLERHQQYTDDVLDSIDDVFYVMNEAGALNRWNESLSDVTGYPDEEISSMAVADFFEDGDRDAAMAAVQDGFGHGSVNVEIEVRTKDGDTIPFEFVASTLRSPSGDTVLAGIGRDVSDRVEREQRLEELVDSLEESNERLEQFAYAASHDLQEPLRMVSSYLQLIEGRYADELDEDGEEFLAFAVDGADRMREMIHGLLQYSRVDAKGDPFESVDLEPVLETALEDLLLKIEEHDAAITVEPLPTVEGDRGQLRQVFQNLVSNAIEYSGDEPPRVQISARRENTKWTVSVSDEGIGIDAEEADRIFEVFQRLHSHEEYEGTGIGLALCQRVVERHGGKIWVESEPSEGSTFSFTLPASNEIKSGHDE